MIFLEARRDQRPVSGLCVFHRKKSRKVRCDALWDIIGMIVGAAIFAEAFPILNKSILTLGDFGEITLPKIIGVNYWIVIFILVVCALVLFGFFEKSVFEIDIVFKFYPV